MIQPTLINLHPNKNSQEWQCYPLVVKLDRCVGSSNTLANDLSNKVCVPNKTEDLNLSMITWINKSKILMKHISCELNANLMVESIFQFKNGIIINDNASAKYIIYM